MQNHGKLAKLRLERFGMRKTISMPFAPAG